MDANEQMQSAPFSRLRSSSANQSRIFQARRQNTGRDMRYLATLGGDMATWRHDGVMVLPAVFLRLIPIALPFPLRKASLARPG
ncbi:hypothetical protein WKW79_15250 [Variovorax robiniae]|uniref:Uncharacterized protein n=1 Tax=Variovorax robiniae TaxID=1836199 RepID=A0ABU8X9Z6_9BURK